MHSFFALKEWCGTNHPQHYVCTYGWMYAHEELTFFNPTKFKMLLDDEWWD